MLLNVVEEQKNSGLGGAVCEIGVHHGRLFILLCLSTSSQELAVAYDLFENQEENTDGSGLGSLEKLFENMDKHDCDRWRVKAIAINSLKLDADRIIADCGSRPRLLSIDGGHSPELTLHDLEIASQTICDGGVIILDDFFNEAWPGVAEGTCRFMFRKPQTLIPFAIAGNKVLLTNSEPWAIKYMSSLRKLGPNYAAKISRLFNSEVLVLLHRYLPNRMLLLGQVGRSTLWKKMRTTALGRLLRWVWRRWPAA